MGKNLVFLPSLPPPHPLWLSKWKLCWVAFFFTPENNALGLGG